MVTNAPPNASPSRLPRSVERRSRRRFGASVRTAIRQLLLRTLEAPILGGRPLETHVVICGFPRSGSTLLLLIAESCYQSARRFHRERSALNAAREITRRHHLLITKRPSDVFRAHELRRFYRPLRTQLRFVLTTRDPRAVLTSRYSGEALTNVTRGPNGYVMSSETWRLWYDAFLAVRRNTDALVVDYADLILRPAWVQDRFASFVGHRPDLPFDQFTKALPDQFETKALNGLRTFDESPLQKWRSPEHRERISQLLREIPDLSAILVREGYEPHDEWEKDYR